MSGVSGNRPLVAVKVRSLLKSGAQHGLAVKDMPVTHGCQTGIFKWPSVHKRHGSIGIAWSSAAPVSVMVVVQAWSSTPALAAALNATAKAGSAP